jgi:type I restriction enzyme S subunit
MDLNNPTEKFDEYWIGEVPEKWKPSRIKNITCLSPGLSGKPPLKGKEYTVLPMEAVTVKGEIDNTRKKIFEDISTGLTHFENGDVLFAKITPCMENGKGAYVNNLETKYGFGSTEFHVMRPGHQIDGTFLYYYTYNPQYRDYAALNMTGAAGQKRVSSRFLAYTRIHLPEIKQQKNIARFLNKAIASIDTTITIKQKQLKTLEALKKSIIHKAVTQGLDDSVELKDSGVEWLGKIPQHWKAVKLKRLSKIQGGLTLGKQYSGNLVERPYLRVSNVQDGYLDLQDVSTISLPEKATAGLELQKKDVLMTEGGDLDKLGRGFLWEGQIKNCLHQNHIFAIRPNKSKLMAAFLTLITSSSYGRIYFEATGKKTTNLASTNASKIKAFPIPLPSIKEQAGIVDFLDKKISQIEKLKKNIVKQIETLELYRKSIVHECVTGKRRITQNDLKE